MCLEIRDTTVVLFSFESRVLLTLYFASSAALYQPSPVRFLYSLLFLSSSSFGVVQVRVTAARQSESHTTPHMEKG